MTIQDHTSEQPVSSIRVITLNCWGLKYISSHRRERLREIGKQLASASPQPQIVGLQECWTQEDYHAIHDQTKHFLPYGKFYHSGFFGGGLVILSAWPIVESSMHTYPLNGRPAAVHRGDWYVGKGVACARIQISPLDIAEVFCTHLHAPYEAEHLDSYACHRTAQAWEIAKLMRHAAERGHTVIGLGDFNMLPTSLAYKIILANSPVRDVWTSVRGATARKGDTSVSDCIEVYGATCDSALNTWRWSKAMRKKLSRGLEPSVDSSAPDPSAKRLDYIFHFSPMDKNSCWIPSSVQVGMIARQPDLKVSLSDHFSVEATITATSDVKQSAASTPVVTTTLDSATLDDIIALTRTYMQRERNQGRWQLMYCAGATAASIASLGAIWRSNMIWLSFLLAIISTVCLSTGMIAGLMGGLFVKQERRALKEFLWEVESAQQLCINMSKEG